MGALPAGQAALGLVVAGRHIGCRQIIAHVVEPRQQLVAQTR